MLEQRRHQRIRFGKPPEVRLGYAGQFAVGRLENLSLSGLMLRTDLKLEIGRALGCEFSVAGGPLIDQSLAVVSRIGELFGGRFQAGLIHPVLVEDAIALALSTGEASVLSVHDSGGRKIMRIGGGLNASLRNDFMHALTRVGVQEIDLGEVAAVDADGLALCRQAVTQYGVPLGARSDCFEAAWTMSFGQYR